jgi:hypothetical protein
MQPYFFPYANYFRLMKAVDEFLIFDCVQFPRRGRVHRAEVFGPAGTIEWLTLPLAYQPREVLIRDLAFAPDARERFDDRVARLPWHGSATGQVADRIRTFLFAPLTSVIDYLEAGLRLVIEILGFDVAISRTSTLSLDASLHGQDRVIAAVQSVGGTHYVNLPGGRSLYNAEIFNKKGIRLSFLPAYEGPFWCLLPALMQERIEKVHANICAGSIGRFDRARHDR